MVELIATVLLFILKQIFSSIGKKKLSDKEFVEHIRAHQFRRANVGKTALDFEEALKQAQNEMGGEMADKIKKDEGIKNDG